jgi:hypothetical protein
MKARFVNARCAGRALRLPEPFGIALDTRRLLG